MKNKVVTPLYKRDQWIRWQDLFKNTNAPMLWDFDTWLKNHGELVQKHKIRGDVVHEVEVDIDEYLAWTKSDSLPINGHTRTDFASHVLIERMKASGDFKG